MSELQDNNLSKPEGGKSLSQLSLNSSHGLSRPGSKRRTSQGSIKSAGSLQRSSSLQQHKVIDTPLHLAHDNLLLLRAFLERLDPMVVQNALDDMKADGLFHRSTFSIGSPTLNRTNSIASISNAHPPILGRKSVRRSVSSTSTSSSPGKTLLNKKTFNSSDDATTSNFQLHPQENRKSDTDEEGDDVYEGETAIPPLFDKTSEPQFAPIEAVDNILDAIQDPESLMKPVVPLSSDGGLDGWLKELGSSFGAQKESISDRRTSRFSSDELSSIVVTKSGMLMVRSKSAVNFLDSSEDSSSVSHLVDTTTDIQPPKFVEVVIQQDIKSWDFDIFQFSEDTGGRPLYSLLWAIFSEHDYFGEFSISKDKFKKFAKEVEAGYLPVPYHNASHAADVVHSAHYLLNDLGMGDNMTPLEKFSSIVACAVHDMRHPGRTAAFLILTQHRLSLIYNDQSVLENYHVSEAFAILSNSEMDITENLDRDEWLTFRKLTIRSVLATDLKEHFETVTRLRNFISNSQSSTDEPTFHDQSNRDFVLSVVIKIADIGHSGKRFDLHHRWAQMIQEEFFQQGDEEAERGMKVMQFNDRDNPDSERNQRSFFEYIALPLFNVVREVYPRFVNIAREARANHKKWVVKFAEVKRRGIV